MLHLNVWLFSPRTEQFWPPNLGAGSLHIRVRNLVPVPQGFVHSENTVHCEYPPSTVESTLNIGKKILNGNVQQVTKTENKIEHLHSVGGGSAVA